MNIDDSSVRFLIALVGISSVNLGLALYLSKKKIVSENKIAGIYSLLLSLSLSLLLKISGVPLLESIISFVVLFVCAISYQYSIKKLHKTLFGKK